jgi:hypothetical protein
MVAAVAAGISIEQFANGDRRPCWRGPRADAAVARAMSV